MNKILFALLVICVIVYIVKNNNDENDDIEFEKGVYPMNRDGLLQSYKADVLSPSSGICKVWRDDPFMDFFIDLERCNEMVIDRFIACEPEASSIAIDVFGTDKNIFETREIAKKWLDKFGECLNFEDEVIGKNYIPDKMEGVN